jgi:hypothetical protein
LTTDSSLGPGVETGESEVEEDEVGVDEVDEVVAAEETVGLVDLVGVVLDVGELDGVEELKAGEAGNVLETSELESDETCETTGGAGEGDSLGDGVVELPTGGSLPAPRASPGGT